eukprot:CAMPEP_0117685782 /NCGR_PEP_ID=MMETSP0804-20121206/21981_1 /TAXON_ID=1074897 /ORGANISM="Tetraselmis astigmatica, Strain CCMP880" /LENGTH=56 /DNA_ID=CAMNT_0005497193 /DNA_START=40 /DNA_END=206 /DNA_ORIENTATION=-
MGAACSCGGDAAVAVQEFNPDGEPKPLQSPEQAKEDAVELRRAARDQDVEQIEELL